MNKKVYKITIRKGKFIKDYIGVLKECRSFLGIPYWWGVNHVRGEESLICHMVNRWCEWKNVTDIEDYTK